MIDVNSHQLNTGAMQDITKGKYFGKTVLVVDDEPMNRVLAIEMLKRLDGLAVDVAENGIAAIAMLKAKSFDVVLMDLQMPKMGGLEATKRIREEASITQVPILALTANSSNEDRQRCLEMGMNDFIAKPYKMTELLDTLSRWLDQTTHLT